MNRRDSKAPKVDSTTQANIDNLLEIANKFAADMKMLRTMLELTGQQDDLYINNEPKPALNIINKNPQGYRNKAQTLSKQYEGNLQMLLMLQESIKNLPELQQKELNIKIRSIDSLLKGHANVDKIEHNKILLDAIDDVTRHLQVEDKKVSEGPTLPETTYIQETIQEEVESLFNISESFSKKMKALRVDVGLTNVQDNLTNPEVASKVANNGQMYKSKINVLSKLYEANIQKLEEIRSSVANLPESQQKQLNIKIRSIDSMLNGHANIDKVEHNKLLIDAVKDATKDVILQNTVEPKPSVSIPTIPNSDPSAKSVPKERKSNSSAFFSSPGMNEKKEKKEKKEKISISKPLSVFGKK